MTGERYVLLGLARPRAAWFRQVGQWATSAALPPALLASMPAADVSASPESGPASVAPEVLGVDPDSATVPWRAERLADGRVTLVFGGIDNVPVNEDAVEVASDVPEDSETSTQAAWSCNVNEGEFSTVLDSRTLLRSSYQVDCNGVSRHRVDWQFLRSSYRGFLGYSEKTTGGWVSSVTNAQTVYAACPRGTAGAYNYKLRSWSVVTVNGSTATSPPFDSRQSGQYGCGTGIS